MKKNLLLLLSSLFLSLFAAEIAFRVLTPFPVGWGTNRSFHPHLLYTLDPDLWDVDSAGFRNPDADREKEIWVLGDSQTYGNNVSWETSWPYQLGRLTGRSVYNFGVGSYGIYQYAYLTEQSLKTRPRQVVVGMYPRNDFYMNLCRVLGLDYWKRRSRDNPRITNSCEQTVKREDYTEVEFSRRPFQVTLSFLYRNLALLNGFHRMVLKPFLTGVSKEAEREHFYRIGNENQSVLIRKKRVRKGKKLTSLSDSYIRTHFGNFRSIFSSLVPRLKENGVGLGVLIIPSKTRVYYEWARRNEFDVPKPLRESAESEIRLTDAVKDFLDREGIPWRDAAAPMVALMEHHIPRGQSVYRMKDGHPFEDGYRVYARTARPLVEGDPGNASPSD